MKITYTDVSPILEAVKQGLRIIAVAVIPLIISQLTNNSFDLRTIAVTGAISLLMAVDKFLHLEQKIQPVADQKPGIGGIKGLTGF